MLSVCIVCSPIRRYILFCLYFHNNSMSSIANWGSKIHRVCLWFTILHLYINNIYSNRITFACTAVKKIKEKKRRRKKKRWIWCRDCDMRHEDLIQCPHDSVDARSDFTEKSLFLFSVLVCENHSIMKRRNAKWI